VPRSRFILASRSPRRVELLNDAGFVFDTVPADIDEETYPQTHTPVEVAEFLARAKAEAVAQLHPDHVVLGADTVVAHGSAILGKPEDSQHARWMLGQLSGSVHEVASAVCLVHKATDRVEVRHTVSTVSMRPLEAAEIEMYVASGDWRGKAGGYGIQDRDPFVTNMGGSLTNIVGLPMELTVPLLASFGILPANS
jgi:septum formation protein